MRRNSKEEIKNSKTKERDVVERGATWYATLGYLTTRPANYTTTVMRTPPQVRRRRLRMPLLLRRDVCTLLGGIDTGTALRKKSHILGRQDATGADDGREHPGNVVVSIGMM